MDTVREHLYLAALLHDIGKFYQRADTGSVSGSKYLKPEEQSELDEILKKADSLSFGMDRDNDDTLKDNQDESGGDSSKKKRMVSILQNINRNEETKERWCLPLCSMKLDKECFPNTTGENSDVKASALWADFVKDFGQIQADTCHAFSETLLSLLFKYTTAIPASTDFPDVSLYDHLKTTAAIAICLYDYQRQPASEHPFLLIGGDLSGIQNYIYQVISKYAAKNLKGRSFYLRILSDAIVRFILKELHLFQSNVIYNSGGSFYILAPNTKEVKSKLKGTIKTIEGNLFKVHGISLFVAVDFVEMSEDSLMHRNGKSLRKVWKDLFEKRDAKKQTKFASVIKEGYERFFMPMGGERLHDSITGEEFLKEEQAHTRELDEEGKELQLREITFRQIQFGKKLRESDVMVVSEGEILDWRDKGFIAPADLGFYYYLLKFSDVEGKKEKLRELADKVTIVSLNGGSSLDCDFMKPAGLNNIYSLEFYGGNLYSGKTFDQMCANDSFSRLGVLRMDVDNLGSLFQSGIKEECATLSRYAALSRSLDYFFSGYLNKIQQEIDKENTFIVYSGGDDVFIVGRWDKTIEMAERIRDDFKAYTCGNPAFSISGGIAIVGSKFPIMKGAEESDMEEKYAKNHRCAGKEKNALSFMGTPLNWDEEYREVKQLKENIKNYTNDNILPKSFISKVLSHALNAQIENHTIKNVKTFWMLTYDLSRMKDATKKSKCKELVKCEEFIECKKLIECKELINNCILEVCGKEGKLNGKEIKTDYHPLELWAFAARWAELEIRTSNQ